MDNKEMHQTVPVLLVGFLLIILLDPAFETGTGLKPLTDLISAHSPAGRVGDVFSLGDFDQDGFEDLVLTMPANSSNGPDSGSLFIFWGSVDGYPAIDPPNADVIVTGEENFLLGQSVAAWDYGGDGWDDLAVGCPGADNGTGKVIIFESSTVNGAGKGAVLALGTAIFEISGDGTHFFGSHLAVGEITGDDLKDLVVLSTRGETEPPKAEIFSGGVVPDFGYQIELPPLSVTNSTRTGFVDLYGKGVDGFVYSSPDSGEVRIIQLDVSYELFHLPGSNATGAVDFQGSLEQTGNTFGWGAGNDGWDTSPAHVYDTGTGIATVRYNQPTGNARGADRSFSVENQLFMEVGGVRTSGGEMSGAYGVSFQLSSENITGISSAVLHMDWEYEDWGFEASERLWIKGRLTDSTGTEHYLGGSADRGVPFDLTPEIYTRLGMTTNNGPDLFGRGQFSQDILPLINGPGEYYLDIGGKISRWTAAVEFGGFGIDNITLTLRTLNHDIRVITGSGGLGSGLLSADVDDDGMKDLLIGSPTQGTVRVFKGGLPYWWGLAGINQGMCNITIEGVAAAGLGASITHMGPSPFTPSNSLIISSPGEMVGTTAQGRVYLFDLPLSGDTIETGSAREVNDAPDGFKYYGWRVISAGDNDLNGYPELLLISWTWGDQLRTTLMDRSPSPPRLWIDNPRRHDTISGHIDIIGRVFDIDSDAGPEDVRFYRSGDNRSWNPIGGGMPDRTEGDSAIKYWNTTLYPNGNYFLKVSVTDGFGLETVKFTDRVTVLNHAPPVVTLIYPADGTEMRRSEQVTAKVVVPSSEELDPPVRFFYSRDNSTWTEFANRSSPEEGSTVDYIVDLDTEKYPDGPIWFMVNATTVYGLGREHRNIRPAVINNYYPPEIEIISPLSNTTLSGTVNVTVLTEDLDNDIVEPVQLFLKKPDVEAWDLLANMTRGSGGMYSHVWNTTDVENGHYDLMARVTDSTYFRVEAELNRSILVHNLYTPLIEISGISVGDTVSSVREIIAVIEDRDMNILEKDVKFLYRPEGLGLWNSMGRGVLTGRTCRVMWDTGKVQNGIYDIRVEVTDIDNLTAADQVNDIMVKNPYPPRIHPDLPPTNIPVSGQVTLKMNISDDEPISLDRIKVEVNALGVWIELENVQIGGNTGFEPWKNISYSVLWDTTIRKTDGSPMFPDSLGYDVRITVMDASGITDSYMTPVGYRVRNSELSSDDDDIVSNGLFLPGWAIAVIAIFLVILVLLIFLFFILRSDKRSKEPLPSMKMPEAPAPLPAAEPSDREPITGSEEREGGIYSPPGWETAKSGEPAEEVPMFTADSELPDLDLGPVGIDEEDLSDIRDSFFGGAEGKTRRKRPAAQPMKRKVDLDIVVDVDLPAGVMPGKKPSKARRAPAVKEQVDREEVDDWEEEEEEWEELEEEEWEELEDEDEWEELEEDEEEVIVVHCRCGEEIEIPDEFKGSKFKCPRCGRKGRIPGR